MKGIQAMKHVLIKNRKEIVPRLAKTHYPVFVRLFQILMVLLFLFMGSHIQAQVKMPDMITPGDTWGIIDVNNMYGGCMQFDSYAELLNTDVQFLKRGMLFVVYDYDGNAINGLDTRAYMFLPASGAWDYNTPFEIPAASQGNTISSAGLESALSSVSLGLGSAAAEGDVSYNLTESKFYVYDGADWVEISTSSAPDSGDTNPDTGTANAGDVFYNTTEKKLYVFDGTDWVGIPTDATPPGGPVNPSDPGAGDVFYNTTDQKFYVYSGTGWIEISTGGSIPGGDTNPDPATAKAGDVFYNTAEKMLYFFDGIDWVEIPTSSAPDSGDTNPDPGTAGAGDVFYNTTEKKLYVFDGTDWVEITGGDNLGNHTAVAALKMGGYPINKDGSPDKGLLFDDDGNAIFENDVTINGNLYTPSDERLKTHIETLSNVLDKINQLRGVQFEYKDQRKYAAGPKIGIVAQELQSIYPSMVTQGKDGYLKVDYTQLAGVLIQAVKEQQRQINELKAEVDDLQEQINDIRQKMK